MPSIRHVAVLGATGLVGREVLSVLAEQQLPFAKVTPLATSRSAGTTVPMGEQELVVQDAEQFDFTAVDLVIMSAGKAASERFGERAAAAGAYVIDNGSFFRMDAGVPLIVPEVNPAAVLGASKRRIIANPNCSTIQLVMALAPLCDVAELVRVTCSTYQSVSGAGQAGLTALAHETEALLNGRTLPAPHFPARIAFNCIPHIDALLPDGSTFEERKMQQETRKILGLPELGMCVTCVRVPVFAGHAVSFVAEFASPIDAEQAREAWHKADNVILFDSPREAGEPAHGGEASALPYPTNIEAVGQDSTLIGRVRDDPSRPSSIAAWCMADNLRKGAASNAVQIAQLLETALANGALPPPR